MWHLKKIYTYIFIVYIACSKALVRHDILYIFIQLTGVLFTRNVILAGGFDGGLEQFAFNISPGSYFTRSVHNVGGEWGSSASKRKWLCKIFYSLT